MPWAANQTFARPTKAAAVAPFYAPAIRDPADRR
jgi:hypothetical protein